MSDQRVATVSGACLSFLRAWRGVALHRRYPRVGGSAMAIWTRRIEPGLFIPLNAVVLNLGYGAVIEQLVGM